MDQPVEDHLRTDAGRDRGRCDRHQEPRETRRILRRGVRGHRDAEAQRPIPSTPMPISSSGVCRVRLQSSNSRIPTHVETAKNARNPGKAKRCTTAFAYRAANSSAGPGVNSTQGPARPRTRPLRTRLRVARLGCGRRSADDPARWQTPASRTRVRGRGAARLGGVRGRRCWRSRWRRACRW